ncbi:MAG: gliding motility-associated C-terminal domain-containing protein [Bacteroidetes bacterium]|nr:gliding motility-associated C-terminal domain-containing protein [Bacteroidota bacterium]
MDDDMAFTVTVTDQCGNTADTTLMAVVNDYPPLEIEVPNDTTVCPGQVVPLWVAISGGAGNYQVNWPGIGSGPQVDWTAGRYGRNITVEVTDACGNTAMASVYVTTLPAAASIDADELSEVTWRFEGDVVPPFGNVISWDFGDGTTASGVLSVTHTYQDYNAYWVVLQIITPDGCVAVDSIQTRPPAATIYFPNSFTPDGDGINDTFGGEGLLVTTYELWVFNRWGQVVFESNDMANRWNGRTPDGEEVPQGIYQYKYIVEGLSMPKRMGFGHITLLR